MLSEQLEVQHCIEMKSSTVWDFNCLYLSNQIKYMVIQTINTSVTPLLKKRIFLLAIKETWVSCLPCFY